MKHKGKKNSAVVLIMCIVLVVLAAFIIVLVMQRGNDVLPEAGDTVDTDVVESEENEVVSDDTDTEETTEEEENKINTNTGSIDYEDYIEIETPYVALFYPEMWSEFLTVKNIDGNPYKVEFYSKIEGKEDVKLFDVSFGDRDNYIGVIDADGAVVTVGVKYYDLEFDDSWSEEECNTVYSMQESSNEMFGKLEFIEAPEVMSEVIITTPYGDLKFPDSWGEILQTEQNDGEVYSVDFYGKIEGKEKVLLFTVVFGGEEGTLIGTVTTDSGDETPVNIIFYDVEFNGEWDDADKNCIFAMQEDANYLIDNLQLN